MTRGLPWMREGQKEDKGLGSEIVGRGNGGS